MERGLSGLRAGCVMLVDDDVHIRASFKAAVEEEGFEVITASNGSEALEKLRSGILPGLIFLDLMMPVMDGNAFRTEQLKDPRLASIPTILISAAGGEKQQLCGPGVEAYLRKPLSLDEMLQTIERFCGPLRKGVSRA